MIDTLIILTAILILLICAFYVILFRFCYPVCESNVCLIGKTALVTGGSSGLGYQLALKLAARGCRVIIIDRVINEEIKTSIIDETNNPNIVLEYVDYASLTSVRNVARKLNDSEEKIDILINNIGIGKADKLLSEDGLNKSVQINYYSSFLLTHLLIDLLKKSKNGRIIFTSSLLAFIHNITSDMVTPTTFDKQLPKYLNILNYANSKFLAIVASDLFAEKLKKWNINCNVYHPGVASTSIWAATTKNINWFNLGEVIIYPPTRLLEVVCGIHPKLACDPALIMAVSKEYQNITGTFYGRFNIRPRGCDDKQLCNKIWKSSEYIVQLKPQEMLK